MSVYKKFSKEQKNYLPRIPMLIMGLFFLVWGYIVVRNYWVKFPASVEELKIIFNISEFSGMGAAERLEVLTDHIKHCLQAAFVLNGISNFSNIEHRQNLGSYVENFIYNEIIRYKPIFYNVYFWRTKVGTEIDFILEGNNELIPIEVKWHNIKTPSIPKSFMSFFENHSNIKRAVVVTKYHYAEIKVNGISIYFIPAILFNKYLKKTF